VTFFSKLNRAVARTGGLLCVGLDPEARRVPERFQSAPEPLLAWNQAIIQATQELAVAYKPNIAFYEALGRPGYDLLRATLAAIPPEIPVILDAKRGDIGSTAEAYAQAIFDMWGADAITVSPYLGGDTLAPFLARPDKGVFILCHTSNPGAGELQALVTDGRPLYQAVAERALRWDQHGTAGLVVGATHPAPLQAVRAMAPDTWLLVPGVGAQGGDLQTSLAAGLTARGDGMLINVSRSLALAPDIAAYATRLHGAIRAGMAEARPHGTVAPDRPVSIDSGHAAGSAQTPAGQAASASVDSERLALALHDCGCVQFGQFTLHSGRQSPIYIDLRLLVSDPAALALAAEAYTALLRPLAFDRIAGIPYAALPIATAVSLALRKPMLYPRKEVKSYGTGRAIEGHYRSGETVAVLDDLITTGGSKLEAAEPLTAAGLRVADIVVLIDREQGGAEELARHGYRLHAVLGIRTLLDILCRRGRISPEQQTQVLAFLAQ
jgi:uridine monophosphate synthetase